MENNENYLTKAMRWAFENYYYYYTSELSTMHVIPPNGTQIMMIIDLLCSLNSRRLTLALTL